MNRPSEDRNTFRGFRHWLHHIHKDRIHRKVRRNGGLADSGKGVRCSGYVAS